MATRHRPRLGTLTQWNATANVPHAKELCVITDGAGVVTGAFIGDGSSLPGAIITAGNRGLAPLRAPVFVGGLSALDGDVLLSNASGKGTRIGGASARFTNQRLFVDGRIAHQIRAMRANLSSAVALSNSGTPIALVLNQRSSDFTTADATQDTAWFDTTNGRFTPLVPGYWWVHGAIALASTVVGSYPILRAHLLRSGTAVASGPHSQGQQNSTFSVPSASVSDIIHLDGSSQYLQLAYTASNFPAVNISASAAATYLVARWMGYGPSSPT